MAKKNIWWVVRGGYKGEAESFFLENKCIAIAWGEVGDLSRITPNRESFKKEVMATYAEIKPGAVSTITGQLFRFAHGIEKGHFVLYPSIFDRQVHFGIVTGNYAFSPTLNARFPHVRSVNWMKALPRTHFTQGALQELSALSLLFTAKKYALEFELALEGKGGNQPMEEDTTIGLVAAEIEQTTHDFILKQLSSKLSGHPLEGFVANLLQAMGYQTTVTSISGDGGIDIIAHRDELGLQPPIVKVQVKSGEGTIGDPEVSQLYGKVDKGEVGLFVTLGTFSRQARMFEASKSNLKLIDGETLVGLVLGHYADLDPRYKAIIPLKKVFVPERLDEVQ